MLQTITVSDLHDSIIHPEHKGELLHCPDCLGEFSANRGDYWAIGPTEELRCMQCDTPLQLVRKITRYEPVRHARTQK